MTHFGHQANPHPVTNAAALVVDNVVRHGAVTKREDATSQALDRFYCLAAAEPKVSMTALQTVGVKGHDGFAIALVTADP